MKFEIISENVLKVTLKLDDMTKWNVTYDNLTPTNPKSNEMFWDIIHMAAKETGIAFDNCKLTVEAMQKDADTFVIFITKKQLPLPADDRRRYRYKKSTKQAQNTSVLVFSFGDFNHLCRFAKNNLYYCLLFENNNSLYKHNDKYALTVNIPPALKDYVKDFSTAISEYADKSENSLLYSSYLGEHCEKMISDNCLKILYDNF